MKNILTMLLRKIYHDDKQRKDRVLEVMSGEGRNYPVLQRYFFNVEMLEQSDDMVKYYNSNVVLHHLRIQNFDWPESKYDCVAGCWSLCYLKTEDRILVLEKMTKSLKENDHIIFIEPIIAPNE